MEYGTYWEIIGISETPGVTQINVETASRFCAAEMNPSQRRCGHPIQQISTKILDRMQPEVRKNYLSQAPYPIGATTIVHVYAPIATSEEEAGSFYNQLQQVINMTPSNGTLIIMGDFIVKEGTESYGNHMERYS